MLPTPSFHHLHLNSVNPDAAIDFYVQQFASTSKTSWGGLPALQSPKDVLLLFNKVDTAPAIAPQSAIWHFGWYVTDVRKNLEGPYPLGDTRAVMIEGPSREALELVEVK